jgi:hypothetical protein
VNQPLLEVLTPAPAGAARRLTTVEKVKAAQRITDSADDALIASIIDGVSADCAREARLARADAADPTFGRETLRATWRYSDRKCLPNPLLLPWRTPIISVSSVIVGTDSLDPACFRILAGGMIERVGDACVWSRADIAVDYVAGWELPASVPAGLEMRVIDQVKMQYLQTDRDLSLRSESTDGLGSATYAVIGGDSIGRSGLLKSLEAALAPYTAWTV